jgi:hypothetical protein
VSGWRVAVSSLAAAGGGPLQSSRFDSTPSDLRRAKALGLVWHVNGTHWQLTRAGRMLAEGRAAVVPAYRKGSGRRGTHVVATWLSALPQPNAIRLDPAAVWVTYR